MNDQSPPKRVTRARATSRADPGVKTARIATAASKAKAARTVSTTTRKASANNDDDQDEIAEPTQDIIEPQAPKPRGRPRKVVAPPADSDVDEIAVEQPKPRGRPRRTPAEAPAPQAPRPRGRPRKVDTAAAATTAADAPAKATRTRAAVSQAPASKKAVQFEETGKENIVPVDKGKQNEVATGLRAKPLRKPAVPRAARGQPATGGPKSPLSPKKTTQLSAGKEDFSDDELAGTGKTPTKALAMSPVKPPTSVFTSDASKKLDFSASNNMKQSVIASPARRPPTSPFKAPANTSPKASKSGDSLLRSPVKLPLPPPKPADSNTALSSSLLRSPARRPQSPMKVAENGSPNKVRSKASADPATPSVSTFKLSKFATPRTLTKGAIRAEQILGSKSTRPSVPKFSGRLSSIMPRDADPTLATIEAEEPDMEDEMEIQQVDDLMVIDETVTVVGASAETGPASPLASPPKSIPRAFSLREVDENPFQDSDSEDETGSEPTKKANYAPATPTPFTSLSKTPRTAKSVKLSDKRVSLGFTPLAEQLSNWMPVSPERGAVGLESSPTKLEAGHAVSDDIDPAAQPSPTRSSYFDEEMGIRDGMEVAEEEDFSPVELDEEDFALAHEADEMSLLEPDQVENIDIAMDGSAQKEQSVGDEFVNSEQENYAEIKYNPEQDKDTGAGPDTASVEEAPSDASQEYGDENAIPIDPALLALDSQAPSTPKPFTPKRAFTERVFHTVSKVPLKAEAESSPSKPSPVKRSASVSKLPNQKPPNTLARSNTVISYSPSKKSRSRSPRKAAVAPDACVTPAKESTSTDAWSNIGTPARTPRQDLNPALLRGAVVFVDVHTTEGADASGLFVELLTQMGARCVKSWNWNGNKDDGSKIGITHVVFKDGGKRTLERARETGGVVSCVGVGWVLE
jgi:hypothetical protein